MLRGLTSDYEMVRNAVNLHILRDREAVEEHVRSAYLNLSAQGQIAQSNGQALVAETAGGSKGNVRKPEGSTRPENTTASTEAEEVVIRPLEYYRCGLPHVVRDCKARYIRAPD